MKKFIITVTAALMLSIGVSNGLSSRLSTYQNILVVSASPSKSDISLDQTTETVSLAKKEAEDTNDSQLSSTKNKANTKTNSINNSKYGELLPWNKVNALIPRGSTIQITDLSTNITFNIKRTFGTNHIDGEALTLSDTDIIKSIWGGFSWTRRPVIVSMDGQKIAASMTAMPHAGVDSAPAVNTVRNRSDNYGTGENLDAVKKNGMDGVVDIHFLNSTRHKDNKSDLPHQAALLKAAGK